MVFWFVFLSASTGLGIVLYPALFACLIVRRVVRAFR